MREEELNSRTPLGLSPVAAQQATRNTVVGGVKSPIIFTFSFVGFDDDDSNASKYWPPNER